jgi:Cof subfamily protein (haloacid dehalogenase superfamily)
MKIHLVAVDLDGTLLNSAKQITDTTAAILRSAASAGVHIVLASARPPRSVMPFYCLLDLKTPMINYNGALVYEPSTLRTLLHRPIPAKVARGVAELARRLDPDVLVSAEILDHWYTDRLDPAYQTETEKLYGPDVIAPLEDWLTGKVTKLLLLGRPDRLASLAAAIREQFPRQVGIVQTEDYLLQIMHASVSKAHALRVVSAEMGVLRKHVMAIGDNANDVGMLQWAAIGVAMGNAAPEALAVADFVTDHHDADGAAKAISRIILSGLPDGREAQSHNAAADEADGTEEDEVKMTDDE